MKKMMSMVEAIEAMKSGNAWEILMSISKIRARRVANELGLDIPARVWRMKKGEAIAAIIEAMLPPAAEASIPAKISYPEHWPIFFHYEGKTYFAWMEDSTTWYRTPQERDNYENPLNEPLSKRLTEERRKLLAKKEEEMEEIRAAREAARKSGNVRKWDYLTYLDECERAELAADRRDGFGDGKPYPAGDIEPNDATHETGANTPG